MKNTQEVKCQIWPDNISATLVNQSSAVKNKRIILYNTLKLMINETNQNLLYWESAPDGRVLRPAKFGRISRTPHAPWRVLLILKPLPIALEHPMALQQPFEFCFPLFYGAVTRSSAHSRYTTPALLPEWRLNEKAAELSLCDKQEPGVVAVNHKHTPGNTLQVSSTVFHL